MWLGDNRHLLGLINCLTGNQGTPNYKAASENDRRRRKNILEESGGKDTSSLIGRTW